MTCSLASINWVCHLLWDDLTPSCLKEGALFRGLPLHRQPCSTSLPSTTISMSPHTCPELPLDSSLVLVLLLVSHLASSLLLFTHLFSSLILVSLLDLFLVTSPCLLPISSISSSLSFLCSLSPKHLLCYSPTSIPASLPLPSPPNWPNLIVLSPGAKPCHRPELALASPDPPPWDLAPNRCLSPPSPRRWPPFFSSPYSL